jgi:predicted transcriptional regulator
MFDKTKRLHVREMPMVRRRTKDVTDAELRVLKVLWDQSPATIRTIREVLYPKGGVSKSATVLKLLERLEAKGYVSRDDTGAVLAFHVVVDRHALIGSELRRIAERLSGNSFTPLLAHLVESGSLSDAERTRLREMLKGAGPRSRRGSKSDRSKGARKKSR